MEPLGDKMTIVLEPTDVQSASSWRWILYDGEGEAPPLATFSVNLDCRAKEFVAFQDMPRYMRWHASIDSWHEDEDRIIREVATWVRENVFGGEICRMIEDRAPCSIRVLIPPDARFLLYYPLDVMRLDAGSALLSSELSFVFDIVGSRNVFEPAARTQSGRIRILAVFSMPTTASALALRTERYKLTRMIREVSLAQRLAIELVILQYGVTRTRLNETIQSGDGWDILHLAGHGGAGEFLLEHLDGTHDRVTGSDLVNMMRPARNRLKLTVISSCQSATATTYETFQWLGLRDEADETDRVEEQDIVANLSIAAQILETLGCPVVAMRYRISDEYAISFSLELYRRIFGLRQPLDLALRGALSTATGIGARRELKLAELTPLLVGGKAVGLFFDAPHLTPQLDLMQLRMAGFPDEPCEFVGRAEVMIQASQALAPHSSQRGVIFTGMVGSGKTACVLELAYRHRESFGVLAYWKSPDKPDSPNAALTKLAASLELQLRDYGFEMLQSLTDRASFGQFLLRFKALLQENSILLVLDNLEPLLESPGYWSDPSWSGLFESLLEHSGMSRVLMTSRQSLPISERSSVLRLQIGSLSRDESALLARQLPNLRTLLHPEDALYSGREDEIAFDRNLLRRALGVVQGNPKLLELLNSMASNRNSLIRRIETLEETARPSFSHFMATGVSGSSTEEVADAICDWTSEVLKSVSDEANVFASLIAHLEEVDRLSTILSVVWPPFWTTFSRHRGVQIVAASEVDDLVTILASCAILKVERGSDDVVSAASVHPGVADAIRRAAPPNMAQMVDEAMRQFYLLILEAASRSHSPSQARDYRWRAGVLGYPYLARLNDWSTAAILIDGAMSSHNSPAALQSILPIVRVIAANDTSVYSQMLLAEVLVEVDPVESERILRDALSVGMGEFDEELCRKALQSIETILLRQGRLNEWNGLLDSVAEHFSEEGRAAGRLYKLLRKASSVFNLGDVHEADSIVTDILAQAKVMRSDEVAEEQRIGNLYSVVVDGALGLGVVTAQTIGEYERSISLGSELSGRLQREGASRQRIQEMEFNLAFPLIQLGRLEEAEQILDACQEIFEPAEDLAQMCRIFSSRCQIRRAQNRLSESVDLARQALRLAYTVGEMQLICTFHGLLGECESAIYGGERQEFAHAISGLIVAIAIESSAVADGILRQILSSNRTATLREFGEPRELMNEAELVSGVDLEAILHERLPSYQSDVESWFGSILSQVVSMTDSHSGETSSEEES